MVLAEKILTAMQHGTANTSWRDFVDINTLIANPPDPNELRTAIQGVAEHQPSQLRQREQANAPPQLAARRIHVADHSLWRLDHG